MNYARQAIESIERLSIPQGRNAGDPVVLAPYQRRFVEGALAEGVTVGVLSIGRGNGKTALSAALGVTHLLGDWDGQPQREVVVAGRTRDQAAVAYRFAKTYLEALGDDSPGKLKCREHPFYSLVLESPDGPHILSCLSADGKSALGGSPTLAILDERAAWRSGKGDELESALLTGLGKRDGRMLIISTSAADDMNTFSQWCDNPPVGCYVQEHRPVPNLDADDYDSLMVANPGSELGIGATPQFLQQQAQQAIQRGGNALAAFRNLVRNERVASDGRDMLIQLDDWLKVERETAELPSRKGKVVIGLDLGGAASMTASVFFWPDTGRMEALGWFPAHPNLTDRGHNDQVGDRYNDMAREGFLRAVGGQTVPIRQWIAETIEHVADSRIECFVADRFKKAEVGEAMQAEGVKSRVVWRGMGWRDGAEDVRRFQRYVTSGDVSAQKSLLMRSALSECVVTLDDAGNGKISKARSNGRIDPAAAAVMALSEASRMKLRPGDGNRPMVWA